MKNSPKLAVIFSLVVVGMGMLQGCLKPEKYPDEPAIEFKFFHAMGDSGLISFGFTDGDGDVGLGENETDPPYDTNSQFYYNVFITYYEKVNGVWEVGKTIPGGEDVEFNYRTRLLTPNGKNKALKGEIQIFLLPIYYNPFSTNNDTIRYRIQMCDRALHLSNEIFTPDIIR